MNRAVREAMTIRESTPPRAPDLVIRGDLLWIEAQYLIPDPDQPRKEFLAETLAELAGSLTEFGVLTPLRVRPTNEDGLHAITDGERRWRAGRLAGVVAFPCFVEAANPTQAFLEAYLANLHRESLSPVDAAVGLQHIRETFQLASDEDVAHRVNKSVGWVRQMNAVVGLDAQSRQTLLERQEPIAVAVGLRPQSPPERQATLDAIASLPSRDRKVEYIGRVNDMRRMGRPIDEAIATVNASMADGTRTTASTGETKRSGRGGRPARLTQPFTWRDIGNGVQLVDVAPSVLAYTQLAGFRTTSFEQWRDALARDVTTFRDACASADGAGEQWESLRDTLLGLLSEDPADQR